MEPASLPVTKGRGSIEDPEVLENVPGHVIPILEREFDDFDTESAKYLRGETPETEFIGFRLKQGVYGQRQPDVQMVRVKLPMGGITPEQLEAFADGIERYAPLNKGHITTRQNIQIHHMPLDDAAKFIRELSDAGLSSREGCGNTVRNVTGDPWAGVAPDELFDLTPYAGAYVRYFVRHPTTQLMPRKVKTAFDASPEDRALTGIHDIAFIARERDGRRGVEVRVGGGTSIMPRVAPTLYDFVGLDDGEYLEVAEAVFRIFDRQDWLRVNRARARIKVLVDKIGIDEMRKLVDEERQGDWVNEREFDVEGLRLDVDEADRAPARPELLRLAQRRRQRVRALPRVERHRPAPGGLLGRPGPRAARRPQPRAAARAGRHRAHVLRRLGAHHRRTRTCCCAGCATRRSTRSGRRCASWASATRAPTRSATSSPARAPTRASSASPRRWASTPRCASASTRCRSPIRSRASCTSR